jgi:hypothetical protein
MRQGASITPSSLPSGGLTVPYADPAAPSSCLPGSPLGSLGQAAMWVGECIPMRSR